MFILGYSHSLVLYTETYDIKVNHHLSEFEIYWHNYNSYSITHKFGWDTIHVYSKVALFFDIDILGDL